MTASGATVTCYAAYILKRAAVKQDGGDGTARNASQHLVARACCCAASDGLVARLHTTSRAPPPYRRSLPRCCHRAGVGQFRMTARNIRRQRRPVIGARHEDADSRGRHAGARAEHRWRMGVGRGCVMALWYSGTL